MELLTGKCKEDFQRYYFEIHCQSSLDYDDLLPPHFEDVFGWFYDLDISFQYGVYVDFFSSLGFVLDIQPICNYDNYKYTNFKYYLVHVFKFNTEYKEKEKLYNLKNLTQARTESIKRANELYNKNKS